MKNTLQRTCMGCNTKKSKTQLIRVVKTKNGIVDVENNSNLQGRGAYICKDINCLEKAIKNKRLERSLKTKIPKEVYEKLRGVIIGKQ